MMVFVGVLGTLAGLVCVGVFASGFIIGRGFQRIPDHYFDEDDHPPPPEREGAPVIDLEYERQRRA